MYVTLYNCLGLCDMDLASTEYGLLVWGIEEASATLCRTVTSERLLLLVY